MVIKHDRVNEQCGTFQNKIVSVNENPVTEKWLMIMTINERSIIFYHQ